MSELVTSEAGNSTVHNSSFRESYNLVWIKSRKRRKLNDEKWVVRLITKIIASGLSTTQTESKNIVLILYVVGEGD